MRDHWKSVEFVSEIDAHGNIHVPLEALRHLERTTGGRINVRLTGHRMDSELKRRGVSGEEIDRIKKLQLESYDQVVRFLLTEGALAQNRRIRGTPVTPGRGTKR
jgi:hypothetical protein